MRLLSLSDPKILKNWSQSARCRKMQFPRCRKMQFPSLYYL